MSDFDNEDMEMEEAVVIMTDEEGNEYYYVEEEVICIGDRRFAILVPIEEECDCECDCGHDHGADAVIAKIETNADGDDVYSNPTDEEFEEVLQVYKERDEEE